MALIGVEILNLANPSRVEIQRAMLKSRNNHPPGGFFYRQSETSWESSKWRSFDHVVSEIIAHREANKTRFPELPRDRETVAAELENQMTERLRSMPGGADYLMNSPEGPPLNPLRSRRPPASPVGVVANVVAAVKTATVGIATWLEFFGAGPVENAVAEKRAAVCAGCEFNVPAEGPNKLSETVAAELALVLGAMHEQQLTTSLDEKLNLCGLCLCPLKSKVFAPNDVVQKNTNPALRKLLPKHCWILAEQKAAKPVKAK